MACILSKINKMEATLEVDSIIRMKDYSLAVLSVHARHIVKKRK